MSEGSFSFRQLSGSAIAPYVPDLARLRIEVFREYPYLYDGDEAYERKYLQTYLDAPRSLAVLVYDGAQLIGASTGLPPAHGQKYRLPAGAFFEVRNGKVARVTNYYNLQDWIAQVS